MNNSASLIGSLVGVAVALVIGVPVAINLPVPDDLAADFDQRTWYFAGGRYSSSEMVNLAKQSKSENPDYSFGLLCLNPNESKHGLSGILIDEVRGVDKELNYFAIESEAQPPTAADMRMCHAMTARINQ